MSPALQPMMPASAQGSSTRLEEVCHQSPTQDPDWGACCLPLNPGTASSLSLGEVPAWIAVRTGHV